MGRDADNLDGRRGGDGLAGVARRLRVESAGERVEPSGLLIARTMAALPSRGGRAGARWWVGASWAAAAAVVGVGVFAGVRGHAPARGPSASAVLSASLRGLPTSSDAVADAFTRPVREGAGSLRLGGAVDGVLGRLGLGAGRATGG